MRMAYPGFLLLFAAVAVLAALYFYGRRRKRSALKKFVSGAVIGKMVKEQIFHAQIYRMIFIMIGLFFLVIALAGPQIGTRLSEIRRRGVDVIVVVDCSKSMLAEDYFPNRIAMAKNELGALINKLEGDRIGIIAFAGRAFVQCPLTLDYGAAKMFLSLIDTSLIPVGGTSLQSAIELAMKTFSQKERKYKALILLTDGEEHEGDALLYAKEARKEGIVIFTVGIGKPEGEVIPIRDEKGNLIDYLKDSSGAVVNTKLNEDILKKIALETDGKYFRAAAGGIHTERIIEEIRNMDKKELSGRLMNQYENRYQFFLLIALVFFIMEMFVMENGSLKQVFVNSSPHVRRRERSRGQ